MSTPEHLTLATRAIADIDQLLYGYDHGGQIESALPLLHQHRRTLVRLRDNLRDPSEGGTTKPDDEQWAEDLVTTYAQLGGVALHHSVYRKMKNLRTAAGRSWPNCAGRGDSGKRFKRTAQKARSTGADETYSAWYAPESGVSRIRLIEAIAIA